MRVGNVAMLLGGLAGGAVFGNRMVSEARSNGDSGLGTTLGIGAGAAVGGGLVAKLAYAPYMQGARHGVNMLGVGALGFGLGAAVSGAITGAFTERRSPVDESPLPVEQDGDPGVRPAGPMADSGTDPASVMRELQRNPWMQANTTAHDRALLAAGAAQSGVDAPRAMQALREVTSDDWVGRTYSSADRTALTVAALEADRTGGQAATTLVNVDGAKDTAGSPATGDIADPSKRAALAQAAIRGGLTGRDAAFTYANIRNSDPDSLKVAPSVRLANAALEARVGSGEALQVLEGIARHPATRGLPVGDQVTLAGGALRGGISGDVAAADYGAFATDEYVSTVLASGELSSSQAARIVAAASSERLSGHDAALTFSNALAYGSAYDSADSFEQLVDLSIGALHGHHTGREAAAAFDTVSNGRGTSNLPAEARFQLAGAALAGGRGVDATVAAYQQLAADPSFTNGTSAAQDALLATAATGAFDATADSELASWYAAQAG